MSRRKQKPRAKGRLERRDVIYPKDTGETLEQLERKQWATERMASGSLASNSKGKAVPVSKVKVAQRVFQWRIQNEAVHEKEAHIRDLATVLKNSRTAHLQPPILTCRVAGQHYVVDGHHRLAAYLTAGRKDIPVVVCKGTLKQARWVGLQANSKDKLAMSRKEKQEAAWTLVKDGELSIRETAECAGISQSQVSRMRKVWERIKTDADFREKADNGSSWMHAQAADSGYEMPDGDWQEKKVATLVDMINKAGLGPVLGKAPDATAEAIRRVNPKLPLMLIGEWLWQHAEDVEAMLEERRQDTLEAPLEF
jgi:hypothetical protein